jgi:hypothetical protein
MTKVSKTRLVRSAPVHLPDPLTLGAALDKLAASPPPKPTTAEDDAEIESLLAELSQDAGFFAVNVPRRR